MKLYEDIEIGLHLPNKKVKKEKKESSTKELPKYIYPLIKEIGTLSSTLGAKRPTTIGGRKTKKRRNRKTNKRRNKKTNRKTSKRRNKKTKLYL